MNDNVAILLCTYNGEKYLKEQLDSLLNQTYKNFVCYVHDDCSNDNTLSILNEYKKIMKSKLIILSYKNENHNASYNFCSLIRYIYANTLEEYIMFCDQDDVWLPNKIEKSIQAIKNYKDKPTLVFSDQFITDDQLKIKYKSNSDIIKRNNKDYTFKRIVFRNVACGCTMCINRKLLELSCIYMNPDNIVMHDWWIMLVAKSVGKVIFLQDSLMYYRQHDSNSLGVDNNRYLKKIKKYLFSFSSSIKARKIQVDKCIKQVYELKKLGDYCNNINEVNIFCKNMKKNKLYRIVFILKEQYITISNFFTILLV